MNNIEDLNENQNIQLSAILPMISSHPKALATCHIIMDQSETDEKDDRISCSVKLDGNEVQSNQMFSSLIAAIVEKDKNKEIGRQYFIDLVNNTFDIMKGDDN